MSSLQISLVIAANKPKKLSEFYAFATNGDLQAGIKSDHFSIVNSNGFHIQVYRPSKKESWINRGRAAALCLQQVPSSNPLHAISEWVAILLSRGAVVIDPPKLESFGAEAWLSDPDGNYFLIFVPKNQKHEV